MDRLTTMFDCCLYLAGLAMAFVVALFIVIMGYKLALTFVKRAAFEKKIRRRND